MLFQRINRSDPEKVFMVVKASGIAALIDRPVAMQFTGTDDGLLVNQADAAVKLTAIVGIADAAIPDGTYGLVQVYGFRSSVWCKAPTTIAAGGTGAVFVPVHDSSGILTMSIKVGASIVRQPNFVAANSASTVTFNASSGHAIFIRCL